MTPFAGNSSKANIALYAAMLFLHLILARISSEPDTSRNQITTRRLKMWQTGEIEELFHEAEAFEKGKKIHGRVVRSATMKTHGSHGPSGVDANE